MVPGISGAKMSSSEEDSKIDLLDDESVLKLKLDKSVCIDGVVQDNGLLAFAKFVIFPIFDHRKDFEHSGQFVIKINGTGDVLLFDTYDQLESAFVAKRFTSINFKDALFYYINSILKSIRAKFQEDANLLKIKNLAYPMRNSVADDLIVKGL